MGSSGEHSDSAIPTGGPSMNVRLAFALSNKKGREYLFREFGRASTRSTPPAFVNSMCPSKMLR